VSILVAFYFAADLFGSRGVGGGGSFSAFLGLGHLGKRGLAQESIVGYFFIGLNHLTSGASLGRLGFGFRISGFGFIVLAG